MERIKCPFCGEEIAATAKKCRFCGEWLPEEKTQTVNPRMSSGTSDPIQIPINPTPYQDSPSVSGSTTGDREVERSILSFFQAYFVNPYIHRYADFRGYTTRKSFWLTYLATIILSLGLGGLVALLSSFGAGGLLCGSVLCCLIGLALTIPSLALAARRLRDAGKNPWMLLIGLIPVIGQIILLIFFCLPSQYEDTEDKGDWQMVDWLVTGVCGLLLILGIIFSLRSLGGVNSGAQYDLGVYTNELSVVSEDSVEVWEVPVEEVNDGVYVPRVPSLLDLIDVDFLSNELVVYRIGNNMNQVAAETGSTHKSIRGEGMISRPNIILDGWLTEDGEIHGRYHNENGINLDFNGILSADGDLYIQLGHGSEKSDWYLHSVGHELEDAYRYEGTWGKSNKPSYVVFHEIN